MRPNIYKWAMEIALITATRATCPRRQVGCVLLDKYNRIIGLGYNGVPRGDVHCTLTKDSLCFNCSKCRAVHAEANALLQCADVMDIETVITTCFPCWGCMLLLKNTGMKRLVYKEWSSMSVAISYFDGVELIKCEV